MSGDDLLMELCRWQKLLKIFKSAHYSEANEITDQTPPTRKRQVVIDEN